MYLPTRYLSITKDNTFPKKKRGIHHLHEMAKADTSSNRINQAYAMCYDGASQVGLSGKESACQCRRDGLIPGKIPWRRK